MVKKSKNRYTVYKYLICHSRKVLEKLEINLENALNVLESDFGKGVGTLVMSTGCSKEKKKNLIQIIY